MGRHHTYRTWTPAEDAALTAQAETIDLYARGEAGALDRAFAQQYRRTPQSVRSRRALLGLTGDGRGRWTPAEDQAVIDGRHGGDEELAERLGRTAVAIWKRRHELRRLGLAPSKAPKSAQERRTRTAKPASTPKDVQAASDAPKRPEMPPGWYGPEGSGHGRGEPWVPGQAFRRTT